MLPLEDKDPSEFLAWLEGAIKASLPGIISEQQQAVATRQREDAERQRIRSRERLSFLETLTFPAMSMEEQWVKELVIERDKLRLQSLRLSLVHGENVDEAAIRALEETIRSNEQAISIGTGVSAAERFKSKRRGMA